MALILRKSFEGYQILFNELCDPRTKNMPFIAKPYQILTLLGLYLMFVLKWGPQWMKNRQPFNVDKLMIVYNGLQAIACFCIFVMGLDEAWGWKYKWICEPVDWSNSPHGLRVIDICYYYFALKVIDLLDTVFFVLRKKNNQISFLHIYHHSGMVLLTWACVTYLPGGHGTLIGVINCFVHTVMYTYYLLTVATPSIKDSLWFKKLVTQLQILQFFWCVVHMATIVFKTDCEYPRWVSAVFLPQNLFMLVLFIDFYVKAYILKPKQNIKKDKVMNNDKDNSSKNGIGKFNNEINKFIEITNIKNNINKRVNVNGDNISVDNKNLDKIR